MIDLDPESREVIATTIRAGLMSALEHEDVVARRIAVLNLGRLGPFALPAVAGLAKRLMHDSDQGIRADAAGALATASGRPLSGTRNRRVDAAGTSPITGTPVFLTPSVVEQTAPLEPGGC